MKLLLILLLLISISSWAETSVRTDNSAGPSVLAGTDFDDASMQGMVVDPPSSDGTSESDPAKAYIPLNNDSDSAQLDQTIMSNKNLMPVLPTSTSSDTAYVKIYLDVTNEEASDYYLHASVKNSSSDYAVYETYKYNGADTYKIAANSSGTIEMIFLLNKMCEEASCDEVLGTDRVSGENDESFTTYFFLSDTELSDGYDSVDPASDHSDGVYYKFYFSDKLPAGRLSITADLGRGDGKLTLSYVGGDEITQMGTDAYETIIVQRAGSSEASGGDHIQDVGGAGSIFNSYGFAESGEIDITGLVNDVAYNFSVALVNKYQFASELSNSKVGTPMTIEAFLESQACYLLSSGFQKKHFIIEYFKDLRDSLLLKYSFGQRFVGWYYRTAPKYSKYIYESVVLSTIVRFMAYISYFSFKYFKFLLLVLLSVFSIYIFKYRRHRSRF